MSDKKIKVMYFEDYPQSFHGAQQSLFYLLKELDKNKFEPIVVCPFEGIFTEKISELGVRYIIFSPSDRFTKYNKEILNSSILTKLKMSFELIPFLKKFKTFVEKEKIQVAHFNHLRSLLIYGCLFKIKKIPIIWHLRGDDYSSRLFNGLMKIGEKISTNIIVVSKHIQNVFPNSDKTKLIYNGLDVPSYSGIKDDSSYLCDNFNIDKESIKIVCVGSLVEKKGQIDLILALPKVLEKYDNIKVLIVGDSPEMGGDDYKQLLIKEATNLGVLDKLIFTGWRNDVITILQGADIFVLPSHKEAFGRVTIEAMYCKLGVIATNSGGTPELIKDGYNGILVEPKNPRSISKALIYLIENQDFRASIGEKAYDTVLGKFTTKTTASKVEKLYRKFIKSK